MGRRGGLLGGGSSGSFLGRHVVRDVMKLKIDREIRDEEEVFYV